MKSQRPAIVCGTPISWNSAQRCCVVGGTLRARAMGVDGQITTPIARALSVPPTTNPPYPNTFSTYARLRRCDSNASIVSGVPFSTACSSTSSGLTPCFFKSAATFT